MKHDKVIKTIKIVATLFGVMIVILLAGMFYRKTCNQNSYNILPENMQMMERNSDSGSKQKEERKKEVIGTAGTEDESSLEIEIEEKNYFRF